MPVEVFGSVIIHFTLVLLCSCNAVNLSTDRFTPPGRFSITVVVDSICGTVFQVIKSLLLAVTQVNSTIWPTLTFFDTVSSIITVGIIPIRMLALITTLYLTSAEKQH